MPSARCLLVPALGLLAASAAPAQPHRARWTVEPDASPPVLQFGPPDGGRGTLRFSCTADGTRLSITVRGAPRGPAAGAASFPTRLTLFLGGAEWSLSAEGTRLPDRTSRVEAPVPDMAELFSAMSRQGRLVAVTFAGRTMAPAPDPDLVARFRAACAAGR